MQLYCDKVLEILYENGFSFSYGKLNPTDVIFTEVETGHSASYNIKHCIENSIGPYELAMEIINEFDLPYV